MNRTQLNAVLGSILVFSSGFLSACSRVPAQPRIAPEIARTTPVAEEISFDQLSRMLPKHPVIVGFDVDDTLLFSAPAFNALQPEYDPAVIRPKDAKTLTPTQREQYHAFWNRLNEQYDDRSIPKEIGRRLLRLHQQRGDDIWIISRRQGTVPASSAASKRIERMLGIKLAHPLVVTDLQDKTPFIRRFKIEYYYGDSDTDMTAAIAAGATPIRVKRASDSYAKDVTHNGEYDEIVLAHSDK